MKIISQIVLKICTLFIIAQIIFIPVNSYATTLNEMLSAGDNFINDGKQNSLNMIDGTSVKTQIDTIYNILFSLGVVLTVIIGGVLGIKFVIGSVEEQAKIKETLIPYVVACVIIYAAFGIWKLMITILSGM